LFPPDHRFPLRVANPGGTVILTKKKFFVKSFKHFDGSGMEKQIRKRASPRDGFWGEALYRWPTRAQD
jgi:hypothetical protein